ncbi:hypothetical protein T484DRAFT_1882573, partial [Baffinella frigidus]
MTRRRRRSRRAMCCFPPKSSSACRVRRCNKPTPNAWMRISVGCIFPPGASRWRRRSLTRCWRRGSWEVSRALSRAEWTSSPRSSLRCPLLPRRCSCGVLASSSMRKLRTLERTGKCALVSSPARFGFLCTSPGTTLCTSPGTTLCTSPGTTPCKNLTFREKIKKHKIS